jgi:hypothetical protein
MGYEDLTLEIATTSYTQIHHIKVRYFSLDYVVFSSSSGTALQRNM